MSIIYYVITKINKQQKISLLNPLNIFIAIIFFLLSFSFLIIKNNIFYKKNINQNNNQTSWSHINNNKEVPISVLKNLRNTSIVGEIKENAIKVMEIQSLGKGKLYIFDFNSPQLCGVGGCLYSIYHESGQLLLQLIANPHLPPKENFIQVSNTISQEFPCLTITQNTNVENTVSHTLYCYQDGKYTRFNESLVNESDKISNK